MNTTITGMPLINSLGMALLATGIAMVGSRRIDRAVRLVTFQALFMSLLVAVIGFRTGEWHFYLVAIVAFIVKGLAAPSIILNVLKRIHFKLEIELLVGRTISLVLACGLVLLAYYITGPFVELGAPRNLLSIALSLLLIGLFMMVSRKTALMQVLGFMLMENGVFLTAVSTTLGMPLVVEMGIFLDVLVGVGLMGLLSHRINDQFATIETTKLNSLKG